MNSEQPQLLSVKTTRPQFSRTQSLRSSAASNEYFSDHASDSASTRSDNTKASYETPPSRISTPITQPQTDSEMTLPTRPGASQPARLATHNNGERQGRTLSSFENMSPPTPGVDDTPYIRFAIEQLTRDEEVAGENRHGSMLNSDLTKMKPIPEDSPAERVTAGPPLPQSQPPPQTPSPPQRPISRRPVPEEVLLAVHPPDGQRWADLGYVPLPLRLWALGIFIFLCLFMIAGLISSNVLARKRGLVDYNGNFTPRYFVFQYLPQLLGILLIMWLFVIQAAMYRTIPYFTMSNNQNHGRLQGLRITPANFVLPDLSWFKNGEPLLGGIFLIFWLMNITIPLLSCLYQTRWITNDGPARWRWATLQGVGWTLLTLYIILVVVLVYCLFRFRSTKSALMWDPISLADLIVLFRRSNICHDFERTEVSQTLEGNTPEKLLRLGYWTTTQRPEIFHGVGQENAAFKRLTLDLPTLEKGNESQDSSFDMERQRYSYASSFTRNIHSPFVRYRWIPWFLRDGAVVAWIVIAILLVIAFLVISFVNNAVQDGFRPLLPSRTASDGFSSSNFLYSFLPALLGMILFLAWQPIDVFFRSIQPFANLASPTGASAERSILASYSSGLPGLVTIQAVVNRDFKLAYITFIGLISLTIPVLAGGVFTAQLFRGSDQVRMVASMPGYIALCVFTTIYALSFLAIWPTRKRYLPHRSDTIADLMSFLYASPLLSETGISNIRTKADLVGRFVGAPIGLTGDEKRPSAKYAFGIYVGRDGKEHLGIDRLQRPGSGEMLVTTGMSR